MGRPIFSVLLFCFCAVALATSLPVSAEQKTQAAPLMRIQHLKWISQKIEFHPAEKNSMPTAFLRGNYANEDWDLLSNVETIQHDHSGNFTLKVPLTGPVTVFTLIAIGPLGKTEKSSFTIKYSNWERAMRAKRLAALPPAPRRHSVSASLGMSLLSYTEGDRANFSQKALTLKVNYNYNIKPNRWSFGANFFVTALPFGSNQPDVQVRFLGANVRVGYTLPFIREPWKISIMTGVYYTTMFVTESLFGFENLMGPQLFPVVSRTIGTQSTVGAYFKLSPVGQGIAVVNLQNREMAGGVFWNKKINKTNFFTLAIDAANLKLVIEDTAISSNSFSISLGIGW